MHCFSLPKLTGQSPCWGCAASDRGAQHAYLHYYTAACVQLLVISVLPHLVHLGKTAQSTQIIQYIKVNNKTCCPYLALNNNNRACMLTPTCCCSAYYIKLGAARWGRLEGLEHCDLPACASVYTSQPPEKVLRVLWRVRNAQDAQPAQGGVLGW